MTKTQAANNQMRTEMQNAISDILTKYGIDSYKMGSYITYDDHESKISFSFTEINEDKMFEMYLESLRSGNCIAKNVTVAMFKSIIVPGPKKSTLNVIGLKPGRPYKVILTNGEKEYTMSVGDFLDNYASHLKTQY